MIPLMTMAILPLQRTLIKLSIQCSGKKSYFTPAPCKDPALDAYITAVETEVLQTVPTRRIYPNITRTESIAINNLQNNSDLVFKEADKGYAIVVMDAKTIFPNATDS